MKENKSVFVRAIKYALTSSSIIIFLVVYRMLTSEVIGTPSEVAIRFIVTCLGVSLSMYIVFVLYLYFNPDAETPREKE
jgi:uncharacterized membrane protein YgaE (UPF0421/DUF939 family)